MDLNPKISIIIPVYNVSDFIIRCLASVVAQTYKGDIECILVDDCGTDDSIQKCKDFVTMYKGSVSFKIESHEKNRGLSAARNSGTKICTGDYIYYLDSDDEMTPRCIELMVDMIKQYPDVQMILGNVRVPGNIQLYDISRYKKTPYIDSNYWIRKNFYKIEDNINVNAWNKLISKEFIKTNNFSFMEGIIHEDQQWMYHVVKKLQRIAFVFEPTYLHYVTPNSIMSSITRDRSDSSWSRILEDVLETIDEPCQYDQIVKYSNEAVNHYNKKISQSISNYTRFMILLRKQNLILYLLSLFLHFCTMLKIIYPIKGRILSVLNRLIKNFVK